jgi:hypothetical protein
VDVEPREREPSSGSLRSRWIETAAPGKPDRTACEFGPEKDSRKPSPILTYPIATLRSKTGACGQSFRLTTTWMIGGGRIDMATLRAVPLGRAPIIPTGPRRMGATASAHAVGGPGHPPQAANVPTGGLVAVWDNVRNPQQEKCDFCGVGFLSAARRSAHRPRLYCPEHQTRANPRAHAVAG